MHDHYTVHSTDGQFQYTELVIAANVEDAWRTHQHAFPHHEVIAVRQHGEEERV
jgi:hypothetical protein